MFTALIAGLWVLLPYLYVVYREAKKHDCTFWSYFKRHPTIQLGLLIFAGYFAYEVWEASLCKKQNQLFYSNAIKPTTFKAKASYKIPMASFKFSDGNEYKLIRFKDTISIGLNGPKRISVSEFREIINKYSIEGYQLHKQAANDTVYFQKDSIKDFLIMKYNADD